MCQINWFNLFKHNNIDFNLFTCYSIIISTDHNYAPTRKKMYGSSFSIWFSNELKIVTRAKNKTRQCFKHTNLNNDYKRLSTIRSKYKAIPKEKGLF